MGDTILNDLVTKNRDVIDTVGTTPAGLHFVFTVGMKDADDTALYAGLYSVGLPFTTNTHLLAIPKREGVTVPPIAGHNLEPVELEGDYNTHFTLFAGQGEQLESRVILDPDTMQFSLDFCSRYAWEISGSTLYFESREQLPDLTVVDNFVRSITPAVSVDPSLHLHQRPQVNEELKPEASKFLCPICKTGLHTGRRWLACPNGHGYMISGSDIVFTRDHAEDTQRSVEEMLGAHPNVVYVPQIVEHGDLRCPNDDAPLEKTPYQATEAFLYVCHSCMYRWIDGQDLDTILGKFRNDGRDERPGYVW